MLTTEGPASLTARTTGVTRESLSSSALAVQSNDTTSIKWMLFLISKALPRRLSNEDRMLLHDYLMMCVLFAEIGGLLHEGLRNILAENERKRDR